MIEFESACLHEVYPCIWGSSGIVRRERSSALVNASNLTPDMSRRGFGRTLHSFAPLKVRLTSRILPSLPLGILGIVHFRPSRV